MNQAPKAHPLGVVGAQPQVMRRSFLALGAAGLLAAFTACDDGWHHGHYHDSENAIVFGIHQETNAEGKPEVTAGYEFLGLANKGGWVTRVSRDGDGEGTCYFERFDHRLGKPRVESGVATFGGGKLPPPGLQILANQPDPAKLDRAGWANGELLTFDVSGFAMPRIDPVTMKAPSIDLAITAVTPAPTGEGEAASIPLKPADSVGVTWTPITDKPARVMISLATEEDGKPSGEVRCFGSGKSGSIIIPAKSVAELFSAVDPAKPIQGRLEIASHGQVTIYARGRWTVYVVATSQHQAKAFTGTR
jgi:hypothetical protein